MSTRTLMCTRKEAERRRWELRSLLLLTLPAEMLAAFLDSEKPPTSLDLVRLAQRRAAQSGVRCTHCGEPLGQIPEKSSAEVKPFTPLARAREET